MSYFHIESSDSDSSSEGSASGTASYNRDEMYSVSDIGSPFSSSKLEITDPILTRNSTKNGLVFPVPYSSVSYDGTGSKSSDSNTLPGEGSATKNSPEKLNSLANKRSHLAPFSANGGGAYSLSSYREEEEYRDSEKYEAEDEETQGEETSSTTFLSMVDDNECSSTLSEIVKNSGESSSSSLASEPNGVPGKSFYLNKLKGSEAVARSQETEMSRDALAASALHQKLSVASPGVSQIVVTPGGAGKYLNASAHGTPSVSQEKTVAGVYPLPNSPPYILANESNNAAESNYRIIIGQSEGLEYGLGANSDKGTTVSFVHPLPPGDTNLSQAAVSVPALTPVHRRYQSVYEYGYSEEINDRVNFNVYDQFLTGNERKDDVDIIQDTFLIVFIVSFVVLTFGVEFLQMFLVGFKFESLKVNPFFGPSYDIVAQFGAKLGSYVLSGEIWRVGTAIVQHAGFIHVVVNGFIMVTLLNIEKKHGFWYSFLTFVGAGVFGYMFSLLIVPNILSCGSQPGLCSWLGIKLVSSILESKTKFLSWLTWAPVEIAFILLYCVVLPFTDPFSCVSSLLCGSFIALMMSPPVMLSTLATYVRGAAAFLAFPLCAIMLGLTFVYWLKNTEVSCSLCSQLCCIDVLGSGWCDFGSSED